MANNSTSQFLDQSGNLHSLQYLRVVILAITALASLLGNGLLVFIQIRTKVWSSTDVFIFAMAIKGFLEGSICIPIKLAIGSETFLLATDTNYMCTLDGLFNHFFRTTSAFLLAAIAVDRYFHTCRPTSRLVTPRRAKFVCSGLVLVCALSSVPLAVASEFGSQHQQNQSNGTVPYAAVQTCVGGTVFDLYKLVRVAVSVAFITVSSVAYVLVFQRLKSSKITPEVLNGRKDLSKIDEQPSPSMSRTGSIDVISLISKRSVRQFIPRQASMIEALGSPRGSIENVGSPQRKVNIAANSRQKNALHEWTNTQNTASEQVKIIRTASPLVRHAADNTTLGQVHATQPRPDKKSKDENATPPHYSNERSHTRVNDQLPSNISRVVPLYVKRRFSRIQLLVTVLFVASLIVLTVEDFLPVPGSVGEWQIRQMLADVYLITSAITPFLYMWLIDNLIARLRCM